ncbi:hypothetical protein B0O80DRAFT_232265 [Mortierella sp. GBAus27b]|nr:hypothetical protein B0O80DRAFT_232265 [Mortierella sp. GBAus27b]
MHWRASQPRCLSTAFVMLSALLLAHAQYQPIPSSQTCNAFIPGQALYVVGGFSSVLNAPIMTQAFSIDLSVSWSIDMPAYKKLSDGPQAGSVPCGLSPDGKTWVAIVNDNVHTYDIASDQWHFNVTQIKSFTLREVTGAVDPDSGKLYIPFGITTSSTVLMFVLETKTPYVYYYSDLGGAPIERYGYTVAWSRAMKSMIYVGGTAIYSYSPSTGWSDLRLSTDGQSPPGSRYFPCVVAAGDSKIIVFGGQNRINNQTTLGDIYILDVLTKKWKQGMSVNAPQGRSAGPCAYSNNQFIIWGGVRTTNGTSTNEDPNPTLMVYNLETNTWTTNYTAPLQPAIGATVGNVVGSVAGGLVVIAL